MGVHPQRVSGRFTHKTLRISMDPTKHYKDKKTGEYLGRFVKTENDYPDGPWRGGVTQHTFERDGILHTLLGPYNDISGYEIYPAV